MKQFIYIFFISIFFMDCNNKRKEQIHIEEQDIISQMKSDIITDTVFSQKQDIFTVSENSLEDIDMFIKSPHTLQNLSDGTQTYYPFGFLEDVRCFQNKYPYFKTVEQITGTDTTYEFSYKESFIKVFFWGDEIVSDKFYKKQMYIPAFSG